MNLSLLEACSDLVHTHHAPRLEDLAAIYGRIAVQRRICDPVQTATPRFPSATPPPPTAPPTATPPLSPTPTARIPTRRRTPTSRW
ncbi:MAG: hypothetical protein U0470_10375 [Anaerolineae bacterium]